MRTHDARYTRGSALFLAVLMLVMMSVIGLAALDVVTKDQQVAGFLNRKKIAFYAAEAGVAEALETLRNDPIPSVADTTLADTAVFPHGQPSYRLDPTVADPIEAGGIGNFPGMNLQLGQNGVPLFQMQYWRVRVQGDAPGGSVARIELVSGKLIAN